MKNTPLYEIHQILDATFMELHEGWNIPLVYTDPNHENKMVRSDVGIADISYLSTLCLTGEDRAKFLHRITSNDVENLSIGEGNYATLLTNRGKIIGDLRVYIFEDKIYISTASECEQQVYTEMDKYIIADDVELTIETGEVGAIAVYGPHSTELVESVLNLEGISTLPEHHSRACEIDNRWIGCVSAHNVGEYGYHLYTSSDALPWLWNKIMAEREDVTPIGWEALESLRIEAGTPRYGTELTETIFPLEAELEYAIDFEKGCYIGQEIVARMKYRGHPNRLLRGIEIDADESVPQESSIIVDDKEIGWVTSSAYSSTLDKYIALGYIRMAHTEEGCSIQIMTTDGKVDGTVVKLPFVSHIT